MTAPDSQPPLGVPRDRVWWALLVAAVLSRLSWVIWVHPPQDHVFSDMAHYVHRGRLVADFALEPGMREMAWQAWGTHTLLAIPMLLLGPGQSALALAGLLWGACSAAIVMLGYELAGQVLPRGERYGLARVLGLVLLLWFPLISHAGFFVSETPYTCALLAMTLGILRMIHSGTGALAAGCWAALAWIVRPQCAVLMVALGLLWLLDRSRHREGTQRARAWSRRIDLRLASRFAIPLLVVLAVSGLRFRYYTGSVGLMAENTAVNLTAGRCHNIVTRAFSSEDARRSAQQGGESLADRRVSLPGFRALARAGPEHPLALRPALDSESIDIVGNIGDAAPLREARRRCYAATGLRGQLHYAVSNTALLWAIARPWPESSDHGAPELLPLALRGRDLSAVFAPLAILGMLAALWGWARGERDERDERIGVGLGLCALQYASLLLVAAVFFGTPRLRTPYDPYALILALALLHDLARGIQQRLRARAS